MVIISVVSILLILYKSLEWLWKNERFYHYQTHILSFQNFLLLLLTYLILLIGFGFLYAVLEVATEMRIIIESGNELDPTFIQILGTGMYFSAVTLFSLGYGDVVPLGIGRWVAVLEALIGYLLPAAFVVRSVIDFKGSYYKERG